MRRILFTIFIGFVALSFIQPLYHIVRAQGSSASELISAINALRNDNGLQPYVVDAGLMASAQLHADYMASTGNITHTRADGSTPATLGFIENIAGGYNMTATVVVYSIWTDPDHWNTMAGITYGNVGAGVAEKNGYVYYVLQVQRVKTGLEGQPTPNFNSTVNPNLVNPVITTTPQLDGSIIHEVLDGQSLWSIATTYNVTIAEIIAWNNLLPTPNIFPGERLLVKLAPTATITPTITLTHIPPTRTSSPTATPRTPTSTATVTLTPTETPKVLFDFNKIDANQRKTVGFVMVAICGIGLLFVVLAGFIRKSGL